jgi:PBP1b-binding outer membrane lipoprotein LpoB
MPKAKYIILILLFPVIIDSCSSTRPAVTTSYGEPNAAAYIEKYRDLAVNEMKRTGIPASITLAQGMIESDFGRSTLSREANNHFGIKCHDDRLYDITMTEEMSVSGNMHALKTPSMIIQTFLNQQPATVFSSTCLHQTTKDGQED